jgi:ribosome-binding ATPase YchF (GTP1/OBG family)
VPDSRLTKFRFTTIDPQRAIGYLQVECACARYNVTDRCKPNYGSCVQGKRSVPIELLDVAGLVPGAHEGKGLGNKFLDDLRHADALVHVVDVSGTTDAEGEAQISQRSRVINHTDGTAAQERLQGVMTHHRTLYG